GRPLPLEVAGSSHPALACALGAYAEHVVGRLRNDPQLTAARDAVAALAREERAGAVAACAHALVSRIGDGLESAAVGATRRLLLQPEASFLEAARLGFSDPDVAAALAATLEA